MPAVIDTAEPRVLHCDYRADCPVHFVQRCANSCNRSSLSVADSPRRRQRLADHRRSRWSQGVLSTDDRRACYDPEKIFNLSSGSTTCRLVTVNDDDDDDEITLAIDERFRTGHTEPLLKLVLEGRRRRRKRKRRRTPFSSHPFANEFYGGEGDTGIWNFRRGSLTYPDAREFSYEETCSVKRKKRKRLSCARSRSYLQLAFFIFFLVFGQNGLLKSNVSSFDATKSAGLSALTIGMIFGAVRAAPVEPMGDATIRAERSANLSHITGASRKIQMYIKNRHLQILPDGTVNGSNDDTSDYTIFQRTSVSRGQLRIQGVATCLYLCMDSCGLLYGSREYTEDCLFNETIEQHNYNTYSSVRYSTARRTLYLGLNRHGMPRRVQAKGHNLGRLSAYARVLTQVAPMEHVEALQKRMLGSHHNVRHRHNGHHQHHGNQQQQQQSLCPVSAQQEPDGRDRFRCRKRKKRKKKRRRCREDETPGPQCEVHEDAANVGPPESKRSCEAAASEEACRREALDAPAKKRKSRIEERKKGKKAGKKSNEDDRKSSGMLHGKRKATPLKRTSPQAQNKSSNIRMSRIAAPSPKASTPSSLSSFWSYPPGAAVAAVSTSRSSGKTRFRDATLTGRQGKTLPEDTTSSSLSETIGPSTDLSPTLDSSLEMFSEESTADSVYFDEDLQTSSSEYSAVTMDTISSEMTEKNVYTSVPTVLRFDEDELGWDTSESDAQDTTRQPSEMLAM